MGWAFGGPAAGGAPRPGPLGPPGPVSRRRRACGRSPGPTSVGCRASSGGASPGWRPAGAAPSPPVAGPPVSTLTSGAPTSTLSPSLACSRVMVPA